MERQGNRWRGRGLRRALRGGQCMALVLTLGCGASPDVAQPQAADEASGGDHRATAAELRDARQEVAEAESRGIWSLNGRQAPSPHGGPGADPGSAATSTGDPSTYQQLKDAVAPAAAYVTKKAHEMMRRGQRAWQSALEAWQSEQGGSGEKRVEPE